MKIIIQKEDLLYAVSAVERASSSKNTLPILSGIKIATQDGRLTFSATDLELAMECIVNAEIIEEGEVVAPGKRLSSMVRLLPSGSVELDSQNDKLKIKYNGGSQSLPCFPTEEFPVLPAKEGEIEGSIPVRVLKRLVKQVGVAASPDEVRPVFTGVYTELYSGIINMVATDTHRLAVGRGVWQGSGEGSLLVPNRALQEIARLAINEDESIIFSANRNQIYFAFANLVFTTRLIVGQYPDYHQVLPKEEMFCSTVIVGRSALSEVLERAALIARENSRNRGNTVRLSVSDGELSVIAEVPDEGSLHEILPVSLSGSELTINFNVRYLLDVLRVIDEERIVIRLTGESTPAVITGENGADVENVLDKEYLYLLLPIRVSH